MKTFWIPTLALTFGAGLPGCRDATAPNPGAQPNPSPQLPPQLSLPGAPPPQLPQISQGTLPGQPPLPGQGAPGQTTLPPPEERIAQLQVKVTPPTLHAVNATFGGGLVRYVGYEIDPPQPQPGQRFRLTHYWRAEKPIPENWTLFVHFGLPGEPGIVANGDHIPAAGAYPTTLWKPGATFRDDQVFGLPQAFPAQKIEVYVGLYQGDTRLPLDQANLGEENRLHVTDIVLGPPAASPGASGLGQGPALGQSPARDGAGSGPNSPLPTYTAARRQGPIHIDGVLDESDWKRAASTGPFVQSLTGASTKYRTEAKLLYDDEFLYVAFTCEDEDVWSDFTHHDDKIYTQEAVELFVDADGDGKTYNELEIAPTNATFDAYFPARRQGMDLSWESGMVSAVKVDGTLNNPSDLDKGWVAEAKIPLKSFASPPHMPPLAGDKWRINLYRLDWHTGRRINEGSAFSPLFQGDFHNLPRFGWLEFGK